MTSRGRSDLNGDDPAHKMKTRGNDEEEGVIDDRSNATSQVRQLEMDQTKHGRLEASSYQDQPPAEPFEGLPLFPANNHLKPLSPSYLNPSQTFLSMSSIRTDIFTTTAHQIKTNIVSFSSSANQAHNRWLAHVPLDDRKHIRSIFSSQQIHPFWLTFRDKEEEFKFRAQANRSLIRPHRKMVIFFHFIYLAMFGSFMLSVDWSYTSRLFPWAVSLFIWRVR
jgi:hypothetical protein